MNSAKKKTTKIYDIPVIIEEDKKGYFFAYAPSLQGCYTQGKSLNDALKNIKDAISLHLEDRIFEKEFIPQMSSITVSTIKVAV